MARLAALALRRPGATLAVLAAATAALAAGLPRLESEAGYRAFLGADHPAVRALDAFGARFGGGLPFAAVWSCEESPACESALGAASLRMAHAVARAVEAVPGVARVDGPATSPLLVRPEIGLPEARRLAPEGEPAGDLAALAARATRDPTWVGQLVSADGRAGALVIQLASSEPETGARALGALREALAPFAARGFVFHLVGGPVEFVVAGDELARNTARLVPAMVALVAVLLALLFRRVAPAVVSLLAVGAAAVWTLGAMGWIGWPQNSLTQVLPPLVLVIGVCDAMHLLAAYAGALDEGVALAAPGGGGDGEPAAPGAGADRAALGGDAGRGARERAMMHAVAAVGRPCLLTTLTTMAGFLSFLASGLESFARFGVVAALGVAAALGLTFTLVPVLAVRLPAGRMGSARASAAWGRALGAGVRLARRRAGAVVALALVAGGAGALGMARLEVDARFEDLYGPDSRVVRWVEGARRLREAETLEVALELPSGQPVDAPASLALLARVETALAGLPGLERPLSILTPARELHRLVHGAPLPLDGSAPERPGQMLRLLRAEEPGLVDLFVDVGDGPAGGPVRRAALRLSLQAGKLPQRELRALLAEVDATLAAILPPGAAAQVTGPLATVAHMIDEIRHTQLASFALAGGLILVLVGLAFRSLAIAAMALVPTVLPVVVTLGAMGWLGLALDVGSAMVAAVVLGLAVDDAIHLLDAYRVRRAAGDAPGEALLAAVRRVGRALVTTSLALAVGFTALALAPWQSVASFGAVSAVAIGGALLADLLVLPAGVLLGERCARGLRRPGPSIR